jgi:hypothetical protein
MVWVSFVVQFYRKSSPAARGYRKKNFYGVVHVPIISEQRKLVAKLGRKTE